MCTTCPCLLREHEPREHLEMEVAPRRPADLPHAARLLVARHLPLEAQQRRLVHGIARGVQQRCAWCAAVVCMVWSSGVQQRCAAAVWSRGVAGSMVQHMVDCAVTLPRSGEGVLRHARLAWGTTRRRGQCPHCLVHEMARSRAAHGARPRTRHTKCTVYRMQPPGRGRRAAGRRRARASGIRRCASGGARAAAPRQRRSARRRASAPTRPRSHPPPSWRHSARGTPRTAKRPTRSAAA